MRMAAQMSIPWALLDTEFDAIWRMCEVSRKGLDMLVEPLHKEMDEAVEQLDEHEMDGYLREINDYYIEVNDTLPRLFWYAYFCITYSLFEKALNDSCDYAAELGDHKLRFPDISGRGIQRARTYLTKVVGVNWAGLENAWENASLYGEIRNCVMHSAGLVEPGSKLLTKMRKLPGFIEDEYSLHQSNGERIMFNEKLVNEECAVLQRLIRDVYSAINKAHRPQAAGH